ncbi:MAG: barstar family protein [Rickettsiales bacterium]|jgi:hypothetical protein|nr:barstar family protein [Rickettsiales bacterium]
MDDRYRQIIFIDGPEVIGDSIKNNGRVFFTEIDGNNSYDNWPGYELYIKFGKKIENWVRFLEDSKDGFVFPDNKNLRYDSIYVYISDVDKILLRSEYYYHYLRIEFFGILNDLTNERVFFLIDKSQKTYVIEQIDSYTKHIKNREISKTNVDRYGQMLFVESLEDVNVEKDDDFFTTIDGEHCGNDGYLYSEFMLQLGFPYWFGRNMAALEDCLTDPGNFWSRALDGRQSYLYLFFLQIKNARKILPENDWHRAVFFGIMDRMCQRVFIIFDKSEKEFVLGEIERYKKTREEKMRIWRLEEQKKKEKALKKEQKPLTPHHK